MKKKFLKISLMAICTSAVLSSCNSEDLQEKVVNNSVESIVTNPYALDKEKALAETQAFFQDQAKRDGVGLRSEQLASLAYDIEVTTVPVSISETSSEGKQVVQEVPMYTIQYKDENGYAMGYAVTIGDERFSNKVVAFNNIGECDVFKGDDSDFWKDRIDGYIYNVVNFDNIEKKANNTSNSVNLRAEELPIYYYYMLNWKTKWHRSGSPYADYTPFRNNTRASVGCTAAAIGEIMAYHRWPRIGAYPRYNNNKQLENVQTSYTSANWSIITAKDYYEYTIPTNASARAHISNLLAEIAYKLNTNFVDSQKAYASPSDAPSVFRQMGFNSGNVQWLSTIGNAAFFEEIRREIVDYKRPVFMTGWKSSAEGGGGHAFIIGGVETNGTHTQDLKTLAFIYVKNGNGGSGDRWFSSDIIKNPSSYTTGTEVYAYRYNCGIITGIYPNTSNQGSSSIWRVRDLINY